MKKVIMVILIPLSIFAQNSGVPLVTDRPDQTESAQVVPLKSLQIETGIVFESDRSGLLETNTVHLATTLLRYGLFKRAELRIGSAFTTQNTKIGANESELSGLNGLSLGTKLDIADESGWIPETALLAAFNLPAGEKSFSGEKTDISLVLAGTWSLSGKTGLGFNAGSVWDESSEMRLKYSLVLGRSVSDNTGAFLEIFGQLLPESNPEIRLDGGFTHLLQKNLQLDLSAGFALSEISADFFLSGGFSIRLPN